jgi:hypothetical protein
MPLDQKVRTKILGALTLGMPIGIVADYAEVSLTGIRAAMDADPEFDSDVRKAIATCMHKRLELLDKLQNWQAVAFILESIWPSRFGRKRRGTSKRAKPRVVSMDRPDFSQLTNVERQDFDRMLAKVYRRNAISTNRGNPRQLPAPGGTGTA